MNQIIVSSSAAVVADPTILVREIAAGNTVHLADVGYTIAPTSDLVTIANLMVEEDEEAADMVSLSKDTTGIDNVIFVSTKYRGRHAPRIKIAVDPPNKFSATGKNTTMTIHDYATVGEPLPRHIFEQARHFIERNRDALLRYWNEEIDTATFIRQLAPPDTQR
jgi:hypothetical protein